MSFALNLRNYRAAAGYSAKDLSQILGVPYPTYTAWENERSAREPKYSMLCDIARALNVTPNDLLGFSPIVTDDPYLAKVQAASAAAAAAAAATLGISPVDNTSTVADLIFNKLLALLNPIGFFIKKDPDTPPDSKFGDSISIFYNQKIVSKDFLYRAYLLVARIRQGVDYDADLTYESYITQLYNDDCTQSDGAKFMINSYKNLFELKVANLPEYIIKDILIGKVSNPMNENSRSIDKSLNRSLQKGASYLQMISTPPQRRGRMGKQPQK